MINRTHLLRTLPLLATTAIAVTAAVACGGGNKDANTGGTPSASSSVAYNQPPPGGYPPGSYPPPNSGYPPPNTGYPNNAPPPNTGYPPPGGSAPPPAPSASSGLPGLPVDQNLLAQLAAAGNAMMGGGAIPAGDPVDLGIKAASMTGAPGMQPDGASVKDTLTPDGHKSMLVTLQGGKCYTFIAFSPPGQVTNVDLHLLTPPFYNMEAGHDDTNTNTAIIGKGNAPLCPFTPFPVQYKLDVHAKAGQGMIGLQMFSKSK